MAKDTKPITEPKKMLVYYIYEVLKDFSDENHPMKQQEIIDKVELLWGMSLERKAVKSNLDALAEMGADIQKHESGGVFLGARKFEPSEVSLLVDAVFSSREINSSHARKLAEKFYGDYSRDMRKRYRYVYKSDERVRSNNRQIFHTIDILNEAIEKKKRVEFFYISYTEADEVKKPTKVSPYYLINSNAKYYLVCARHRAWGIANYRIERMTDIRITDEDAALLREVKGCDEKFDIVKYANENIYMFGTKVVNASILVKHENALAYIYEWFGDKVRINRTDDGIVAEVKSNEQALIYWLLQYGEHMELKSPESTREKMKKVVKKLFDTYQ